MDSEEAFTPAFLWGHTLCSVQPYWAAALSLSGGNFFLVWEKMFKFLQNISSVKKTEMSLLKIDLIINVIHIPFGREGGSVGGRERGMEENVEILVY